MFFLQNFVKKMTTVGVRQSLMDVVMGYFLSGQVTLGFVNLTKILRTAFTLVDPKSVKNSDKSPVSFFASGSAGAKAVRRMLMKLSPIYIIKRQLFNGAPSIF